MTSAELQIIIKARDDASKVLGDIDKKVGGLGATLGGALTVGAVAGAAGVLALGAGLVSCVGDAMEGQKILEQTNAVIASTKGVAGMTAQAVGALANSLSRVIPIDDELIQSTENMLLTFTNVGRDIFPQATEAALNMATALGQDSVTSAMQLGKALNDPIAGVTALRKVGVMLTDQQEDQVKAMVKAGDVAGAQTVILKELGTEFGNSGRAAGETAAGQYAIFNTQLGNIKETIGTAFLPMMASASKALTELVGDHQEDIDKFAALLGEKLPEAIDTLGQGFADVSPVLLQAATDVQHLGGVAQDSGQWLIDHNEAMVVALVAVGAAFIWANPAAGIAMGIVAIAGAAELLRTDVEKMPRPLLELRLGILEVLEPTLKVIETLTDFHGLLKYIPGPLGDAAEALSGVSAGAEELANTGLADVQQNLRDTQARLDEMNATAAMEQLAIVSSYIDVATASSGSLIDKTAMMNQALGIVDTTGAVGQLSNMTSAADNAREALARLVATGIEAARSSLRDFLGNFGSPQSRAQGYASGGWASGLAIVGERGPELLALPGGSRVYSNTESQRMLANQTTIGRQGPTYNIYAPVYVTPPADGGDWLAEAIEGQLS